MLRLESFILQAGQSIKDALKVIDSNGKGICFILEGLQLVGVLTDGDIRRALIKNAVLDQAVNEIMNRDYVSLPIESDDKLIRSTFTSRIKIIPLCDERGSLVDLADSVRSHRIPVLEPELNGRELEYLEDCVKSNWISSQGLYVGKFEKMVEEICPGTTALAVSNGTVALQLALLALGVGTGDEVIVPDLTFAASINAVLHTGATPVISEVEHDTWCMNPKEVLELVSEKTKAIMPVHLYGQTCNMDSICRIAEDHKLLIIEDCAEAIGSQHKERSVGTFGDAGTFSFFGNKTITTGEGGMVVFREPGVASKATIMRDHGMSPNRRYWHELVGYNFRLTNLQAAIGVAQMERLPGILEKKRQVAGWYDDRLSKTDSFSQLPRERSEDFNSYWLYTVRLKEEFDRDRVMKKLLLNGIETRPAFNPLHQMPPYQQYGGQRNFECSNNIAWTGLSLPSSVTLNEETVDYICNTFSEILNSGLCIRKKF